MNIQKEFKPKLKLYHSFILSCLLTTLLIINSNHLQKIRTQSKLNYEKNQLFNNIISKRYLEGQEEQISISDTKKVCEKGSKELNKYYETGNLNDIELKEGPIKCKDKNEDYMQALINILKSYGGGLRMRNLEGEGEDISSEKESSDLMDNLIIYGKHIIPILIFLVVAILCIPGWVICCFCCCCNCCCCCCCKKPGCKLPCFIISYAMYALVVAVCIYGLSQSNHIFIGLANTECSILKFFDEILVGESKNTLPKWAGINGIETILTSIKGEVESMGNEDSEHSVQSKLEGAIDLIDNPTSGKKHLFLNTLETFTNELPTCQFTYNSGENTRAEGTFILDLENNFGTFQEEPESVTENSLASAWVTEYKEVSQVADTNMVSAKDGFNEILGASLPEVTSALDQGIDAVDSIDSSFSDIKGGISELIINYSEVIDEYGKLGIKVVFGVLALIDIGIAVFVFLLCFCSGKACVNCCCCRCIFKLFIHILWNILALLMIIVFLVGSIFALLGKIGDDSMSLFSFLVSEDNLGEDKETLLLGGAKEYLIICVNGDGKIEDKLGFQTESIDSLNDIKYAEGNITQAKIEFESRIEMFVYNNIIKELENRKELKTDFAFINTNNPLNSLEFKKLLNEINNYEKSTSHHEKWEIDCPSEYQCHSTEVQSPHENNICFTPGNCFPLNRDWVVNIKNDNLASDRTFIDTLDIISKMKRKIKDASKDGESDVSFKKSLDGVGNSYNSFLRAYITALGIFEEQIQRITNKLKEYTGNNGLFSFINCKFIGTNLKIILKYLKESLGKDFYTVGVCLILVGCSLALAISSTILLIIIINTDIKKKEQINNKAIPEYPINSDGRVIQYNN